MRMTTSTSSQVSGMTPAEQFETLRPQLFALSYRALGSRAEAEDIVQDAYLRWQSVRHDEVASPKAYLMTTVSRLALDQLKSARRKREEYIGVWLPEPLLKGGASSWPEEEGKSPEQQAAMAESLSTAFLFVLESLSPPERIAFLLHDVFSYEYAEIAAILESSEPACRQLVSRARKHVKERRPRFPVDPERHRAALDQFFAAVTRQDMTGLLAMLREDAVLYSDGGGKASAAINPVLGADRVARFFIGISKQAPPGLTTEVTEVNGVPTFWLYENGVLTTLFTLDLDEYGRIAWVLAQRNPDKLAV